MTTTHRKRLHRLTRAAKTSKREIALAAAIAETHELCADEGPKSINLRITDWVEHYAGHRA